MKGLTDTQHRVLTFVNGYTNKNGYPPTVREVVEFLGANSIRVGECHLFALGMKGYMDKGNERLARQWTLTAKGREAVTPLYFKYEEGTFVQISVS